MVSEKIAKILEKAEPIPNELGMKISEIGIQTGSTVFGAVAPKDTDVDLIIPPDSGLRFSDLGYCIAYDHDDDYNGEDFQSCYVKTQKGTVLNLIFPHNDDALAKWAWATEACKVLSLHSAYFERIMREKEKRIKIFEFLKNI